MNGRRIEGLQGCEAEVFRSPSGYGCRDPDTGAGGRHSPGVRLHERFSRHGERDGDIYRDRCPETQARCCTLRGAALPVVFATGIRVLAWATGGDAELNHARAHPLGDLLAGACFLVVVAGAALGIGIIAATGFGKEISFDNGYPTFVTKEG
jgi:hypothetical protein